MSIDVNSDDDDDDGGSKKKVSGIWVHFTKDVVDGVRRGKCKHCPTIYLADSKKHGTSNMNNHLSKCEGKDNPFGKKNRQVRGQTTLSFEHKRDGKGGLNLKAKVFSMEAFRKSLARMVVLDEVPFNFITKIGFLEVCQTLNPMVTTLPCRKTVTKDVEVLYDVEMNKLKKLLKDRRVCLTTDTWTSIQNLNYMVLTSHFIGDDWNVKKRILNFCQIDRKSVV